MFAHENVAIGIKKSKNSRGALTWALNNLVGEGNTITLIHVHPPLLYVPTPVGRFAVDQLSERKVNAYRQVLQDGIDGFVEVFKAQCAARKVQPNYVQVESESIQMTLINQVTALRVGVLVLGASSNTGFRFIFRTSGSNVSGYVLKNAPPSCSVIVVSKNKVVNKKDSQETETLSSSPSLPSESPSQESGSVANVYLPPEGLEPQILESTRLAAMLERPAESGRPQWGLICSTLSFFFFRILFSTAATWALFLTNSSKTLLKSTGLSILRRRLDIPPLESIPDTETPYKDSVSQKSNAIPREFLCPLTNVLMEDPVQAEDGQNYERTAIVDLLLTHGQTTEGLSQNRELRRRIAAFRSQHVGRSSHQSFWRRHT